MTRAKPIFAVDLADMFDALAEDVRPMLIKRLDDIWRAADPAMRHVIDYDPALSRFDVGVLSDFARRIRAGEFSNQQTAE